MPFFQYIPFKKVYDVEGCNSCAVQTGWKNLFAELATCSYYLLFTVPPMLTTTSPAHEGIAGEGVMFAAAVVRPVFPNVTSNDISWTGPSGALSFGSGSRYSLSSDSLSLTIADLVRSDTGLYTVNATTRAGSRQLTFNLTVFGKLFAVFKLKSGGFSPCALLASALADFLLPYSLFFPQYPLILPPRESIVFAAPFVYVRAAIHKCMCRNLTC